MKINIYFLVTLIFFSTQCSGKILTGTWRVDIDRTLWFNSEILKHTALAMQLLKCTGSNEQLTFIGSEIIHSIKEIECEFEDKKVNIEGFINKYSYKMLYSTDKKSVILKSSGFGDEFLQVINWISSDIFWVDEIYNDETKKEMRYFFLRE